MVILGGSNHRSPEEMGRDRSVLGMVRVITSTGWCWKVTNSYFRIGVGGTQTKPLDELAVVPIPPVHQKRVLTHHFFKVGCFGEAAARPWQYRRCL